MNIIKNLNDIPIDDIGKLTKAKADNYSKVVNSKVLLIGVTGTIAILQAIIILVQNRNNNKLEEEKMRHEEEMMRLEIEKMKIENSNKEEE